MRRADSADFASIFSLMQANVSPPWDRDSLKSVLDCERNDVFVEECGGEIIGYIIIENVLDEGCVTSVAVSKEHRRKGIGKKLLENAVKDSRADSIYLEVNEQNIPAIALYASCGFDKISERKKYYGDDAALVMRREKPS